MVTQMNEAAAGAGNLSDAFSIYVNDTQTVYNL
jgi:hypothetical protein